ncbi:hypothetical protein ACFXG6_23085, partial [Streptomyces roseus]
MAEHEESPGGVPPLDEEAAWAAIVAGYGQEPPDPPGARPFRPIENLMLPEEDVEPEPPAASPPAPQPEAPAEPPPPKALGSSVVFAPGVGVGAAGAAGGARRRPHDRGVRRAGAHFQPPPAP